jgi:hypothetical protein
LIRRRKAGKTLFSSSNSLASLIPDPWSPTTDVMLKAILWDNDGVLVDTEPLYFRATAQVLEKVGVKLTEVVSLLLNL